MKRVLIAASIAAAGAFAGFAAANEADDQAVRNIAQGVFVESEYSSALGQTNTTWRIAHSDGNLMVVADGRSLPGVEFYSVSPDEQTVNFWVKSGGKRKLATLKRLSNIGVLRMTMPDGNRHTLEYVRRITDHDERALFRGVLVGSVDRDQLDEYERLVFDEGLNMDQAQARIEGGGDAGPSFDCGAGLSGVETLICNNGELSALDAELSSTYQALMADSNTYGQSDLTSTQVAWLEERNQCASKSCLTDAYRDRIEALEEYRYQTTRTTGGMRMD